MSPAALKAAETGSNDMRWSVSGGAQHSSDSDTIVSNKESLQSEYKFSSDLSFHALLENLNIEADKASGLTTIKGSEAVSLQGFLLGLKQQYNDKLTLETMGGFERSSADTDTLAFMAKADWWPVDTLQTVFTVSKEMHAVSPQAISLNVAKTEGLLHLVWHATKRFAVDGSAAYADFSDNNARRSFIVSPRYRVMQDAVSSLDAGVRFRWFSFDNRLNDGYYSPERYQAYSFPFTYYRQFGEHHMLLSLAPGMYKDQNTAKFQFAGDAMAEAVFKVNEAWDFNVHAALIRSGGITSSEYEQRLAGIALTRRF